MFPSLLCAKWGRENRTEPWAALAETREARRDRTGGRAAGWGDRATAARRRPTGLPAGGGSEWPPEDINRQDGQNHRTWSPLQRTCLNEAMQLTEGSRKGRVSKNTM